jgi:hypothetical protein
VSTNHVYISSTWLGTGLVQAYYVFWEYQIKMYILAIIESLSFSFNVECISLRLAFE